MLLTVRGQCEDPVVTLLFVYGTLQHPPLLARLLGRVPEGRPATLAGHRAAPIDGRVYPGLVADEDASTSGRLLDVTDEELAVLDAFEGHEYERVSVAVRVDGIEAPAEAWLLTGPSRRLVRTGHWSFERFLLTDVEPFLDRSAPGEAHPGAGA